MRDRIQYVDGQCSSNGNCSERNKNGGEEFPCMHCECREPFASVIAVRHLLCIVEHHGVDVRECSGLDLRGAYVSRIRGDRGCVGALVAGRA